MDVERNSVSIQTRAKQLLDLETRGTDINSMPFQKTILVCEKLRVPLAKLAGVEGYSLLLKRALSLAAVKVDWLKDISIQDNGTFAGFETVQVSLRLDQIEAGNCAIVTEFLELLATFIGEPLMVVLLKDAWPDIIQMRTEKKS